ncbi:outer membrane protein assembly factor BamB family protein [Lignipirellula cremea]|uniref:Outer membrane protein assembly factor BamB n=1 Tax=Lignipirellula cremea TaxID=2528010 RepID=A0A518DR21_9BACT|nr:PQQ-binding-like beta-propeller repeat protein [Lignipirellula cremea]QDU94285.1 Outer membrane protein assembly factor BamB [Lignipirellula cremea]
MRARRDLLPPVGQLLLPLLASLLLSPQTAAAADWPHWRGPDRNDHVSAVSGFADGGWLSGDPAWRKSLPVGSGSCVIGRDRLYSLGWSNGKEVLSCLDAATGETLWTQSYAAPKFGRHAIGDQTMYGGPSASPEFDPATGGLYTLGADGELRCWNTNADGKLVWRWNLYDEYQVGRRPDVGRRSLRDYGYTTAPLVQGDAVIVEVGAKTGCLMAFHKLTGKRLWASQSRDEAGHTGGVVPITVAGVPCAAVLTLRNLLVVRLDEGHAGETVALFPWATDYANNIPTPAVQGDSLLITSSYNHGQIVKLKITLQGAKEIWRADAASGVCSPVIHQGHVYWAWRGVHCLDWETGRICWEGGRVGAPGSCIVTGDDRLLIWSDNGQLSLVETASRSPDKYLELATLKSGFREDAWPHLVLANGRLYCQDRDGHLHCYPLPGATAEPPPRNLGADNPGPVRPQPEPEVPVLLESWPGSRGYLFAWQAGQGAEKLDQPGEKLAELRWQARGKASFDEAGVMQLEGGSFLLPAVDAMLLERCRQANALSLELVLTSDTDRQQGPARIVSFSTDGYHRNFSLTQENRRLSLRLRTPRTGENGLSPATDLVDLPAGQQAHLLVACRDGEVVCYLNGQVVKQSDKVQGDFSNWSPQHFLVGGEWEDDSRRQWRGQIERLAVHARFIEKAEAEQRSRLATGRE